MIDKAVWLVAKPFEMSQPWVRWKCILVMVKSSVSTQICSEILE